MSSKTIVFIHGMFVTPLCWEQWIARFEPKGYHCLAPAWPGREQPVETLRKNHPDRQLGNLTLAQVVDHYAGVINSLNESPILIGHSMGGLITQLLLQRGLGAAGVAIDSAPPSGVFTTRWSFVRSNWPVINPFVNAHEPYFMPFEHFQYTFMHTMPLQEQKAAYDKFVVPESRLIGRGPLTAAASVDFKKPHPPLLLIAGEADHIIPAPLNKSNFQKYTDPSSITGFKEFAGRTHFIIGQNGWEEVADYALTWLNERGV